MEFRGSLREVNILFEVWNCFSAVRAASETSRVRIVERGKTLKRS